MPINEGRLNNRSYFQYGDKGKRYFYATERGKKSAYTRACKQAAAIKISQRKKMYADIMAGIPEMIFMEKYQLKKHNIPRLMEKVEKDEVGAGVTDFIKNLFLALKGNRGNIKPSSRKVLEQYGDLPIKKLFVARAPLSSLGSFIFEKFRKGDPNQKADTLFHLFLVADLDSTEATPRLIRIEKNQNINIVPYVPSKMEESLSIDIPSGLTINKMLETTINTVGKDQVFDYNAFEGRNCQNFIMDMLNSNHIPVSDENKQFILQDVASLADDWVKKLTYIVTSTANRANILVEGEGNLPYDDERYIQEMKNFTDYKEIQDDPEKLKVWIDETIDLINESIHKLEQVNPKNQWIMNELNGFIVRLHAAKKLKKEISHLE